MRIAIAGISVEVLVASPLTTGPEAMQIYRGQQLIDGDIWMVRGIVARLRESPDVEMVPLLWATALPGGVLTRDNYDRIKQETLDLLASNGPFDGVCLANHGALEVEGLDRHGDTDFILAIRDAIGPDTPLAVAFDMHGNLTPEIASAGTVFSALRTAPHRDDKTTGYRAADQLVKILERGLRPTTALIQIPILIPGEKAVTHYDPAKTLFESLPDYDHMPGVMQALLMVGFGWNDRPWSGMTALVTTEGDQEQAQSVAARLAGEVWNRRHEFVFPMETASIDEGIARASASASAPVFLSDSGDNTTMGAPGDLTIVLQHILQAGVSGAFVPGITAPRTVRQCHDAGVGAQIDIVLGSEHVSIADRTMPVRATVEAVGDALRLGGFQPYRSEEPAWARVRIGDVVVTFHELPIGITTHAHFDALGVRADDFQMIVVKVGYLHPQLEELARRHILLLSPGTGNLDFTSMDWHAVRRPIFPLDPDMAWQPEIRAGR